MPCGCDDESCLALAQPGSEGSTKPIGARQEESTSTWKLVEVGLRGAHQSAVDRQPVDLPLPGRVIGPGPQQVWRSRRLG